MTNHTFRSTLPNSNWYNTGTSNAQAVVIFMSECYTPHQAKGPRTGTVHHVPEIILKGQEGYGIFGTAYYNII